MASALDATAVVAETARRLPVVATAALVRTAEDQGVSSVAACMQDRGWRLLGPAVPSRSRASGRKAPGLGLPLASCEAEVLDRLPEDVAAADHVARRFGDY